MWRLLDMVRTNNQKYVKYQRTPIAHEPHNLELPALLPIPLGDCQEERG